MPDDLSEEMIFLSEVVCAAFLCRIRAMIASINLPIFRLGVYPIRFSPIEKIGQELGW